MEELPPGDLHAGDPDIEDLRRVLTGRLELSAAAEEDTEALFPIFGDPAGWWYEPEHLHTDPETTRLWLGRAASRWTDDGLSYWSARLRAGGEVIGTGGVQRHRSGGWNLSYRIAAAHQGRGYAGELARAGLLAAAAVDPGVPLLAWILERNVPSRRVAERLGLLNRGRRLDANDGRPRLAYADRPLDDAVFPPYP